MSIKTIWRGESDDGFEAAIEPMPHGGAQASVRVGPEGEFELGEASELEEARGHRSTARRRR
jgi:hypothetical protein